MERQVDLIHGTRQHFSTYGQLKSVVVVHKSKCAFVNFATRTAAELAADRIADAGLTLQGHPLRVTWGKARPQGPKSDKKKSGKDHTWVKSVLYEQQQLMVPFRSSIINLFGCNATTCSSINLRIHCQVP